MMLIKNFVSCLSKLGNLIQIHCFAHPAQQAVAITEVAKISSYISSKYFRIVTNVCKESSQHKSLKPRLDAKGNGLK